MQTETEDQTAIVVTVTQPEISISDEAPMTDAEFQRLDVLETRIESNWQQIAQDSKEIKESKLYRRTRDGEKQTWEEYCKRFQGKSKQYVDRTIRGLEAVETLKTETTVSVFPETASQAASLNGLEPGDMATATEEAFRVAKSENRNVTEKDFKNAVEKVKPPKKSRGNKKPGSPQPKTTPQPAAEEKKVEIKLVNTEPTGSVGLNINSASLIGPIKKFFQDFGLKPQSYQNNKGTVFTFEGSANAQKNLLENLADLVGDQKPLDMRITLE